MANKKSDTSETVEALVLLNCGFGSAGQVVSLPLADAKVGEVNGMLDLHIEAVEAAKA